jgi:hypothetical protein
MTDDPKEVPKFVRRLMPTATEAEHHEATQNFKEYLAVVWRMYERIKRERVTADSPKSETHARVGNDHRV